MPFSHHSHSGQFCGHGENLLEEIVQTAIGKEMEVYAMTEHMPREPEDFYPEEIQAAVTTDGLARVFDDYYHEAVRLRTQFASRIEILIGFETDWIRPSSNDFIRGLLSKYDCDLFIGSVHHVHTIPIDYSREMYMDARQMSGGTDEKLFEDYFDLHYEMLKSLKPPIVGHFDLIRLLSDCPNEELTQYPGVWQKVLRNLDYIAQYGGVIELNSAGLRKGLNEPYPKAAICKEFIARGGRFTISDDAHSISQVGTNYAKAFEYAEEIGIANITVFEKASLVKDHPFPNVTTRHISLDQIKAHPFFS